MAAPTNPLQIRVCFGELHHNTYIRKEEVLEEIKIAQRLTNILNTLQTGTWLLLKLLEFKVRC
jgi:hypothetical protein